MTRKKSPFNSNYIFVDTNVLVGGYSGDIVTNNYKDYRLFYNISVVKPDGVRTIPQ